MGQNSKIWRYIHRLIAFAKPFMMSCYLCRENKEMREDESGSESQLAPAGGDSDLEVSHGTIFSGSQFALLLPS